MDRRSELPSVAAARARRDLHLEKRLESNQTTPTDAGFNAEPTTWVFTKRFGCGRVAQPNESRLSCGAELEGSQREFYHTGCKTFSGSIGDGRRQLQALVRLRTTSHSLGPSSQRPHRSTRRNRPRTVPVTPPSEQRSRPSACVRSDE